MPYNSQGFSEMLWGNDRISNDVKSTLQQLMEAILGTQEGSGGYNQAVQNMNQVIYGDQFGDQSARDALAAFFPQIAASGYRVTADDARDNIWDNPGNQGGSDGSSNMQNTTGGQIHQDMPQGQTQGGGGIPAGSSTTPGFVGPGSGGPRVNPGGNDGFDMNQFIQAFMSRMGGGPQMGGGPAMSRGAAARLRQGGSLVEGMAPNGQGDEQLIKDAIAKVQASSQAASQPSDYQLALRDLINNGRTQYNKHARGRESGMAAAQVNTALPEDNPYMQMLINRRKATGGNQ